MHNLLGLVEWTRSRPVPPVVVIRRLWVPGYAGQKEAARSAVWVGKIDPDIPDSLSAFGGAFAAADVPWVSETEARSCVKAAKGSILAG